MYDNYNKSNEEFRKTLSINRVSDHNKHETVNGHSLNAHDLVERVTESRHNEFDKQV